MSPQDIQLTFLREDGTNYIISQTNKKTLRRGFSNLSFYGCSETLAEAVRRESFLLAINASTFDMGEGRLRGKNMHEGDTYVGIPNDYGRIYLCWNEDCLLYSSDNPTTSYESLLGFFPIIELGKPVLSDHIELHPYPDKNNPQQVLFQLVTGELGALTVEGRTERSKGCTPQKCVDILLSLGNVRFAYLLDGGGSTTTYIPGHRINSLPEDERPVQDYIFI